jgi:pilus assembly protein FimV
MSSGKNPLVLMMALSVPGAAHALGLGEIHVDSALNERLAAEIDIVGATPVELNDLRAAVANRETFARYGADRPAFLSSATFKVTQDSQGRPVLAIRSTESFTEPAVNLLVDVRWSSGELVRQYTLLLDPAGFTAPRVAAPPVATQPVATQPVATQLVAAAPPGAAQSAEPTAEPVNPPAGEHGVRKTTHIKVGAKATLRGIAWRVGERSESDLQRMMLAIFRANPTAFEGNINRLHLGAVLTIPSSAEVAAITKTEARREIRAQMAAWRTSARAPTRTVAASSALPTAPVPDTAGAATAAAETPAPASLGAIAQADAAISDPAAAGAKSPDKPMAEALDQRIQSLERELNDMKGLLQSEHDQMLALQAKAARAAQAAQAAAEVEAPQAEESTAAADAPEEHSAGRFPVFTAISAGLAILAALLAAAYVRFRRRAALLRAAVRAKPFYVEEPTSDSFDEAAMSQFHSADARNQTADRAQTTAQNTAQSTAQDQAQDGTRDKGGVEAATATDADDATQPALPMLSGVKPAGRSEASGGSTLREGQDTTVNLRVDTVNLRVDPTRLDYNFLDLDMTAQHVQMPSVLNENAVVKERRTNLADVLKLAIEREPDRHDLRIKLLELYYSAAATNRQAFLDVVQKFARDRDYLPTDQWDKIAFMGRQIASENPLFAVETADDDDLADCA